MKINRKIQKLLNANAWAELSRNFHLLPDEVIEKYGRNLSWNIISGSLVLSEDIIEKFQDKVNWGWISRNQQLSEAFIEKYQDKVDWYWISSNQKLSEAFIEKFQDKVDWYGISCYQQLSPAFAKKHLTKDQQAIQAKKFAKKSLAVKREEVVKYAKKWNLKFDGEFLYAFRNHDKWGRGSFNNAILYEKGKEYRDWHCDMDEDICNSFGLGIWPKGNTPVKVAVKDWGCAVEYNMKDYYKGRVFAFTVLEEQSIVEKFCT